MKYTGCIYKITETEISCVIYKNVFDSIHRNLTVNLTELTEEQIKLIKKGVLIKFDDETSEIEISKIIYV